MTSWSSIAMLYLLIYFSILTELEEQLVVVKKAQLSPWSATKTKKWLDIWFETWKWQTRLFLTISWSWRCRVLGSESLVSRAVVEKRLAVVLVLDSGNDQIWALKRLRTRNLLCQQVTLVKVPAVHSPPIVSKL